MELLRFYFSKILGSGRPPGEKFFDREISRDFSFVPFPD